MTDAFGPAFADFAPLLDQEFRAATREGDVALRLVEVRALPHVPNAPRGEPFALLFAGPASPALEQATHRLSHARLGELDIVLVPVERTPTGGLLYEAIFN